MNAKATTDLTTLDDDGLHAELEAADEVIRGAQERKRAVKDERDRRALSGILDGLNDTQKAALAQQIGLQQIESTAAVGKQADEA